MVNIKRSILGLVAFIMVMLVCTMNVSAAEINVANTDDLSQKLAESVAGDTLILADGTYTTDLTIDKNITIKGTSVDGTIINGSVVLNTEGIEVTLDTLTVTDSATIIDVKATSTLNVNNAKVIYAGYDGTFAKNSSDGIWLEKTANGSTVNVVGSTIVAKYAIWVYGEENKVSIDDSTINGWAAIDITNGNTSDTTAKNNNVIVNNSNIIGTNVYSGSTDAYGVIVIGGQSNLTLEINESTVNISREEASNKIEEYLKALKISESYNEENIKLIKDGLYNKTYWTLYLDDKFRIDIDAYEGILVKYVDLSITRKTSQKKLSTDDILKEIDECYELLKLNEDYKIISYYEREKEDSKVLDVLYALTEDDIYNSIYVEYDIISSKIISILNISYGKQDKKVNISKEKAIEILKDYDKVDSIENVRVNMGQIVLQRETKEIEEMSYNNTDEKLYTNEYEVKLYWEVMYNKTENVKIDVETGEVINEGTLNFEEKKE